jgi:hypothetical protein
MLSLRSHLVAIAAIERPFTRPNDWSCMRVTKHGANDRPYTGLGKPARA